MAAKLSAYHPKVDYEHCTICQHEDRTALEQLFLRHERPTAALVRMFKVKRPDLELHMDALGLTLQKANNTEYALARMFNQGMETLDKKDVSVETMRKIAEHIDKRDGKIINRIEATRPQILIASSRPSPGGELPAATIDADFEDSDGPK